MDAGRPRDSIEFLVGEPLARLQAQAAARGVRKRSRGPEPAVASASAASPASPSSTSSVEFVGHDRGSVLRTNSRVHSSADAGQRAPGAPSRAARPSQVVVDATATRPGATGPALPGGALARAQPEVAHAGLRPSSRASRNARDAEAAAGESPERGDDGEAAVAGASAAAAVVVIDNDASPPPARLAVPRVGRVARTTYPRRRPAPPPALQPDHSAPDSHAAAIAPGRPAVAARPSSHSGGSVSARPAAAAAHTRLAAGPTLSAPPPGRRHPQWAASFAALASHHALAGAVERLLARGTWRAGTGHAGGSSWEQHSPAERSAPWQRAGHLGSADQRRAALLAQLAASDRDFTPEDYQLLSQLDEVVGPARHRGADPSVLARLPVRAVGDSTVGQECAVCLCPLQPGERARWLPCLHAFHADSCIDPWLRDHDSCPVCKVRVDTTL